MFDTLAFFGIVDSNDAQCFQLRATVEAASWLLLAASLILGFCSHFVLTASTQKSLGSNIPPERRRHNDRWSSMESAEVINGVDDTNKAKSPKISPIPPRFTDYYALTTRKEYIEKENDSQAWVEDDNLTPTTGATTDGAIGAQGVHSDQGDNKMAVESV